VYLFYLDESGHTGNNLNDPNQPITWMVALAIKPEVVPVIEESLRKIAKANCPTRASAPDFEFKGSSIFQATGDFQNLPPAQRVTLQGDIVATLTANKVRIFARGIDKDKHQKRATSAGYYLPSHPYLLAFMYLVESLDSWLEKKQPKKGESSPPVFGLVVADEQQDMGREIVKRFTSWREYKTDFGFHARTIEFLIDTIHYVPSHDSWLLQLTDCVAFLLNRRWRNGLATNWDRSKYNQSQAAVDRLWQQHCQPCVEVVKVWP
jgi:hypothetical protein